MQYKVKIGSHPKPYCIQYLSAFISWGVEKWGESLQWSSLFLLCNWPLWRIMSWNHNYPRYDRLIILRLWLFYLCGNLFILFQSNAKILIWQKRSSYLVKLFFLILGWRTVLCLLIMNVWLINVCIMQLLQPSSTISDVFGDSLSAKNKLKIVHRGKFPMGLRKVLQNVQFLNKLSKLFS